MILLDDLLIADPYVNGGHSEHLRGLLDDALREFMRTREIPFIRLLKDDNARFLAVGSVIAHSSKWKLKTSAAVVAADGSSLGMLHRDSVLQVFEEGRPLQARAETFDGRIFHIWLLEHQTGVTLRFWVTVRSESGQRCDDPRGDVRVLLTDAEMGWELVRTEHRDKTPDLTDSTLANQNKKKNQSRSE